MSIGKVFMVEISHTHCQPESRSDNTTDNG